MMTGISMMFLALSLMIGTSTLVDGMTIRITDSASDRNPAIGARRKSFDVPPPDSDCPGIHLAGIILRHAFSDNDAVLIKEAAEAADPGSTYQVLIFPADRPLESEIEVAGGFAYCLTEVSGLGDNRAQFLVWRTEVRRTRVGFNRGDGDKPCEVTIPVDDQRALLLTGSVPTCHSTNRSCTFDAGETAVLANDPCGTADTWRIQFGSPSSCLTFNSQPLANVRTAGATSLSCVNGVLSASTTDVTTDPPRTLRVAAVTEISCVGSTTCPNNP